MPRSPHHAGTHHAIRLYEGASPRRRSDSPGRNYGLATRRPLWGHWWFWASLGAAVLAVLLWPKKATAQENVETPPTGGSMDDDQTGTGNLPPLTPTTPTAQQVQAESSAIDVITLRKIFPYLSLDKAAEYLPYLNDAMIRAGVVTPLSIAAFLAQVGAETAGLQLLAEIWLVGKDPSTLNAGQVAIQAAQARYETMPRLGNNQTGDGYKYRGRGALQITGRGAYTRASTALPALGIFGADGQPMDLVGNPDLVATDPRAIFGTAYWYWIGGTPKIQAAGGLTPFAEAGNFAAVSAGINAGDPSRSAQYGIADRSKYYETAKKVLGVS